MDTVNIVNVNVDTMYTVLFTVYTIFGWSVVAIYPLLSEYFHALPATHTAQPKTDAHASPEDVGEAVGGMAGPWR